MYKKVRYPSTTMRIPEFMKPLMDGGEKHGILSTNLSLKQSPSDIFHLVLQDKHIELFSQNYDAFQIDLQFENKFSIDNNILCFSRDGDSEVELLFINNEMEQWRKILSKRLCQKYNNLPFKTLKRISVRNQCAIFLAEQQNLSKGINEYIAIKTFRKSSLGTGRQYEDFKNEIKIMNSINHPSVCQLLSVCESDNCYYICMPHYEDGTLLNRHTKSPLSLESIRQILKQLLCGLNYLHKKGIVHRDIKPQNILMKKYSSSEVVIIDFGLATHMENLESMSRKCGTPGYVAPQIFKCSTKSPYDSKCDIFSLGILFYWLLAGKNPYFAKNQEQMKIQNYTFNFQTREHPFLINASKESLNLLSKMLRRDPKVRISAQQALQHPYFYGYYQRSCSEISKQTCYVIHPNQQSKFSH